MGGLYQQRAVFPVPGVRPSPYPGPLPYTQLNDSDYAVIEERVSFLQAVNEIGPWNVCGLGNPWRYTAPPWDVMPPQGRRFKRTNNLSLASFVATSTNQNLVTESRVGLGLDGIITEVVATIEASGGTGYFIRDTDPIITWTLAVNTYQIKDYGYIVNPIGSLTTPCPIPGGGIRIYSGNHVAFYVRLSADAPGILNPNAAIVCSFAGWTWPR